MRKIEYSTKPITMGEVLLSERCKDGDVEAIVQLALSRTDLELNELLALDVDEWPALMARVVDAISQSVKLTELGKAFD